MDLGVHKMGQKKTFVLSREHGMNIFQKVTIGTGSHYPLRFFPLEQQRLSQCFSRTVSVMSAVCNMFYEQNKMYFAFFNGIFFVFILFIRTIMP